MTPSGPTPACCMCRGPELADVLARIWRALKPCGRFLRELQGRRRRRPRYAQSLLQLSVAGLAARDLCRRGQMGVRCRSRAAKSEDSTTRWRRCCSSLPKKAAEERPPSPRYCPDIAAVRRVREMPGGCGCSATALRYESVKDMASTNSACVGMFWECRTGNAVNENEEVLAGHRSRWPGIRPDDRRRPRRPALHQSPRTGRRLRLDRLLHRRQRRRRAWPRSLSARLVWQYGVALFDSTRRRRADSAAARSATTGRRVRCSGRSFSASRRTFRVPA